ncbi:tRNA threonylcarbamoyladenosine biosynthesis protein TsaB [Sediminihabitans luteus]|uniref:tRNA threonylcarbamoyladenosine biosynthesis protein TsaB n=1 Tax=Sediminihabitans luteus TaxID=1138585 RepID=A0A2M9CZF7_9CELL|nr:tRNA (adenosine(37)-N6)-threonylcarbamoyltransferase complex dimerization subunit type 1 TsaB [Sediminihabitans luteus]PJJ77215.1 tRNA threonylcarbamoyladenosine biosynthesis protein TsaB [Sediminihabitans luteus]GII98663.1 tRNA (adenosine(37)-N6)-threonylcarbamoyltransferase complex dimerization subunit type 1 TsaB [Sediminihabitans luteus]
MALVSIDTSASVAAAIVADDGTRLASASVPEQRRHAELLAPLITDLLAEAGVARTDVRAVVGGTGPAPFTGLRVGLVTARTFALALGVPVLGVPSLDAVAAQAVLDLALVADDAVLVATDARRKQVYRAHYVVETADGPYGVPRLVRTHDFDVCAASDAAALAADGVGARAVAVGPGVGLYADAFAGLRTAPDVALDPVVLARLALARRDAGEDLPTEPLYLRRPDVQLPAERKRATAPAAGAAGR